MIRATSGGLAMREDGGRGRTGKFLKHGHGSCVEGGMIFRSEAGAWRWRGVIWLLLLAVAGEMRAAADVVTTRDTLVYKDGDRVQGTLVTRSEGLVVFKSDRFGELRVPADDAVVILAEKPPGVTIPVVAQGILPAAKAPATAAERADEERVRLWDRFSPGVLTAKVRNFFGPWHGRLAFSSEVVSDSAERNNFALEAQLRRKWEKDEVQLNARFDYAETNDVRTTDLVKAWGSWRREFNQKHFTQYRPTVEWNRAARRDGVPNDYVLLQQEIGIGYHLLTTASRKVRLGVSQNRFDLWNLAPAHAHTARGVQSAFEEVELKLPWQMGLTQRGVWYPVGGRHDGWENRIELNKKLTETLSTSVQHEIRRDNPDGSAQDYTRLKLLFGLDF